MTELLTELLNAGLIENLDGDDERFAKIKRAAESLAQSLCEHPPALIRAILAALDPDISGNDPAISSAEQALVTEWNSVRSIFTDTPVNLLRAILLAACNKAAENDTNVAILWLTAADTLPLLRLSKEESVINKLLEAWAERVEEKALADHTLTTDETEEDIVGELKCPEFTKLELPKVDRNTLSTKMVTAVGSALNFHNGYQNVPVGIQHAGFAERMYQLFADELDALSENLSESQSEAGQEIQEYLTQLTEIMNKSVSLQQSLAKKSRQSAQIRLNALWWSEALYSSSLQCSYRKLSPELAATTMAVDLLGVISKPAPASAGYLLAETVNRLPQAGFDQKLALPELFKALHDARNRLPNAWPEALKPPPDQGRLSLRDLAVLALTGKEPNFEEAMQRIGVCEKIEMSLPEFAHALFRQEQAVQLAEPSR
ncbi:GTPase-associated system all-helical protein GASH [Candidatus Methylospira mobilis]|uniref:GTPase-associated system all-helical protein GASH n=1 Tax=Candidatus Methylospira mobilis TaxID=1808979 RepID=UPI0028E5C8EE|nr:GTPase-associated system all-helical protein GASH [Candidatus Methylospira mobilis]WNV06456.1 GTPase-associated system all-helical protein GASH [Candidatus Methylospira mobilis]